LKGVVFVRPLAFKLLTLLLTIFLLLLFSLSAFARPPMYWLATRDLDEQPHPHAFRSSSYFAVIKTTYGFVLMPVFVKSSKVSNTAAEEKPNASPRANEVAD